MINFILAAIKWPVALAMVLLFLPALKADILIVYHGITVPWLGWFFLPFLGILIVWLTVPGISGSSLTIFEHEATHLLFALLTWHAPRDIHVQRGIGGNFVFAGRGNWLIFIAPYFFPLAAALVVAAGGLYIGMNQIPPNGYWLTLGLMTGYHCISTLDEIHVGQTDFKAAGRLFSILFLPGANALMYGLLLSFSCYGFAGWPLYIRMVTQQTRLLLEVI